MAAFNFFEWQVAVNLVVHRFRYYDKRYPLTLLIYINDSFSSFKNIFIELIGRIFVLFMQENHKLRLLTVLKLL